MEHIDLRVVLHRRVSGLYGDLVTRPTGRAVRDGIEEALRSLDTSQVAVIDFGTVRCLDYSCAEEIVGKLLLAHGHARYFLLQGVTPSHCEAIEHVLERHKLAVVARDREGRIRLLGHVPDAARQALAVLSSQDAIGIEEIARHLSPSEPHGSTGLGALTQG